MKHTLIIDIHSPEYKGEEGKFCKEVNAIEFLLSVLQTDNKKALCFS